MKSGGGMSEEFRDYIIDFLKKEIEGPRPGLPFVQLNGEEVLPPEDSPSVRYGAGVLFPSKLLLEANEGEDSIDLQSFEVVDENEDVSKNVTSTGESDYRSDSRGDTQAETDIELIRANEFSPSALGITAYIKVPSKLTINVKAAQYYKNSVKGYGYFSKTGDFVQYKDPWFRVPINEVCEFSSDEILKNGSTVITRNIKTHNENTVLELHVFSRVIEEKVTSLNRFVTVTLINRTESKEKNDALCFYQCGISLQSNDEEPCINEYPKRNFEYLNDDDLSLEMLYRNKKIFAVGHGCASDWSETTNSVTSMVSSSVIPVHDVPPVMPVSHENLDLSMNTLRSLDTDGPIDICNQLATSFSDWIQEIEKELEQDNYLKNVFKSVATKNINLCTESLNRIQRGIKLLSSNENARHAFSLMNESMVMQNEHYRLATESDLKREWVRSQAGLVPNAKYIPPDYDKSTRTWRPFQLAFILMTIPSIIIEDDESIKEREIVDLIWFPTGGGKTEAYLGLAAFTIFYRRLVRPSNGGTTALMRYTLRLLTTQQYQRAASLICACESIRRRNIEILGQEDISIGLWVGGSVTPNSESAALVSLKKLHNGDKENPFIVLSCPWCGVQMGPTQDGTRTKAKGYKKLTNPNRVRLVCEDPSCDFNTGEGLPLMLIDEQIYKTPPTLLIGTVDKFALMPWYPKSKSIFGLNNDLHDPPDLIIQDELHLISGPLGSMVGHYETLIDEFTKKNYEGKEISAKIIASTATISKANEQVSALYGGRKSSLFPPQGLEAGISFFAKEETKLPGRTYVGIFASALSSLTTTEVRVLSSLLQAVKSEVGVDLKERDAYWTLMVYFNSIRELGHAATLLRSDIRDYLDVTAKRLGYTSDYSNEAYSRRRYIVSDLELTSRIQNSEITEYMDKLFTKYNDENNSNAVDICLATNMIQVGLDVSRLSLMAIVGQPKSTSEYIQASSRVGRSSNPGLVVTLLSPSKPRDRSHYEHFKSYHQSLYKHVEPTSVTPFSIPVTERALHALVIAFVRFWGDEAQSEIPKSPSENLKFKIKKVILNRVLAVDKQEKNRTEKLLDGIFDFWDEYADQINTYGSFSPKEDMVPLMYPTGFHPYERWDKIPLSTPSSMRNVDASCNAEIIYQYSLDADDF
jgi:hypothetical protein